MYSACGQAKQYRINEIVEENTCTFTSCSEWQPLKVTAHGDRYNQYKLGRKTTPFHIQTMGLHRLVRVYVIYKPVGDDERKEFLYPKTYSDSISEQELRLKLLFNPSHLPVPLAITLMGNLNYEEPLYTVPNDDVKVWTVRFTDHPGVRIDCNGVTIYDIKLNRDELYRKIMHDSPYKGDHRGATAVVDSMMKKLKATEKNVRLQLHAGILFHEDVDQMKIRIGE